MTFSIMLVRGVQMKVAELLTNHEFDIIQGSLQQEVSSLAFDSRQVKEGSMFFCIRGFQTDGHLYIQQAIEHGAAAIMLETMADVPEHITVVKVVDTRKYLPIAAAAFYGHPSQHLDLIGVTGTNGKTTITYLLKEIMKQAKIKNGLMGTISNWIGDKCIETKRTTPESTDFQHLLKQMLQQNIEACVMEVSSHSLSLHRVDHTKFHTGVFTNLTADHLDFHPTMEDYYQSKRKLFLMTSRYNVINGDDPYGKRLIDEMTFSKQKLISYGIDGAWDLRATELQLNSRGVRFRAIGLGMDQFFSLGIPGRFSVYNAIATIAAARSLDIEPDIIKKALASVTGVPGRLERVPDIQSFSVIVDYAHTPDALENVLNTIKQITDGRLITVFGCGGDRDTKKRPIMGRVSGTYSDYTILTSDNPRSENPQHILCMVEEGVNETGADYCVIENRREAIRLAMKTGKPGDVVIIAGKGHETTQTIGHITTHFDDREVAREVAREEGIQ